MTTRALALLVLALVVTPGCSDRDPPEPTDAGVDSAVCDPAPTDDVDLLFVLDRGPAAHEARVALAEAMTSGLRALASGDLDLDGTAEQAPIGSLHVGVVTGDLGTSGFSPLGCAPSLVGDGAQMLVAGGGGAGCAAEYPRYQAIEPAGTSAADAAQAVRCIIENVADGCPISQTIEAPLMALEPRDSRVTFLGDRQGQGDGANAGFSRRSSVLAIVYLAATEDCNVTDPDFLNPSSTRYPEPFPLRCTWIPAEAYPNVRYLESFEYLQRPGSRYLLGAIAGIPPDIVLDPVNFTAISADPRMRGLPSASDPTRVEPVCEIPPVTMGGTPASAEPAQRIVNLAFHRGDAVFSSICAPDYSSFYRRLGARIARAREPTCGR